jgi:hypothetical protein
MERRVVAGERPYSAAEAAGVRHGVGGCVVVVL